MIANLVEHHVAEAYDQLRRHFPDFCGCDVCRADVMVHALNRIPARYVASPTGSAVTELQLDKDQTRARIDVVVMEGFQKVSRAPRCGRQAAGAPPAG
jgi:competence protein ComFB